MRCRITGTNFEVTDAEKNIIQSLGDAHPLLTGKVPLPDTAPLEFLRQISCFGNLINLFKSKSAFSGKAQLSRYNPELEYKICTPDEFWSLDIDNTEFGKPYDFNMSFFSQINDLLKSVYLIPLNASSCEGSDYVNGAMAAKNSYLCFGIFNSQDCMYSYMLHNCSDCLDCIDAARCQFCYDCHTIRDCYACNYCSMCTSCVECNFCEDCISCQNCMFSYGLRNAKYCIANKQLTKAEYEKYLNSTDLSKRTNVEKAKKYFKDILLHAKHKTNTLINADNSSGEFLTNVSDVFNSYYVHNSKNCGYMMLSHDSQDFWRGFAESVELGYQSGAYNKAYCTYNSYMNVGGAYNMYCLYTYNSCNHCFGSIGLNKKSYCILNKQYTKEEYFDLVPRIIAQMQKSGDWGHFFPTNIAPHYYEHAFCHDWFEELDQKTAEDRGYRIGFKENSEQHNYSAASLIPDSISDVILEISNQTFTCDQTHKAFKFQKKEVEFHQKFKIPLSQEHWQYRIRKKIADHFLIPKV